MHVDSTIAARALLETWGHMVSALERGWIHSNGGGLAAVSGVPARGLNGVWVDAEDADAEETGRLLDEVAATGLPHSLQCRPGAFDRLSRLATSRGMTRGEDIPLMVLEDSGHLAAAEVVGSLAIRALSPEEAPVHAHVAAAGFELPEEMFLQLMTPALLAAPGVRCYLGEAAGEPVTTGLGVTIGHYVAIFNIATPPAHRRRGYGAAITARAVADGLGAGATWSWLQASQAGEKIYERLGFRTMETWPSWVTPHRS